ncbi:MAG: cell division protein FtsZ, partial [Bacteroidota bacterium]
MEFDLHREKSSIIKVIGVGGGGSNAVNHMYCQGIKGVEFVVCNTDDQALRISPVPNKIQLGASLTNGRGAGSIPEVGKNAAIETIDELKKVLLDNTHMVFITAGMGGGTGTGAAPVIAQAAREMGILTVAIVTLPFDFEGKKRRNQADDGIEQLKKNVDSILIIRNERLREMFGNLKLSEAFSHADNVLTIAAKGIAEIITVTGHINVDFEDVKTAVQDSGRAIMGSATAAGENRAVRAIEQALASPLLNDNNIKGARYILMNISSGSKEVTMDEIGEITDYIQDQAGLTADIIWGNCYDESLDERLSVTIIATGFKTRDEQGHEANEREKNTTRVHVLEDNTPVATAPVVQEVQTPVVQDEPVLVNTNEKSSEPSAAEPAQYTFEFAV